MTDTFVVRRKTGDTTQDETTGRVVPVYADQFTTKGKLQMRGVTAQESEAGGRMVATTVPEWHTPLSAQVALNDDIVELTASLYDPQLVGTKVRIVRPMAKSHATARRYVVELDG